MTHPRMDATDWTTLLTLSVLWGGSFFFVSVAVTDLPPLTIVLARVGLAALILHLVLRLRGENFPTESKVLTAFLVMGLINNVVPFTLFVWAQAQIAGGLAAILNATTPLFGLLVAHVFTDDEKLNPRKISGMFIGFGGVMVMLMPSALTSQSDQSIGIWPQLACLGSAVAYAFGGVYARRFSRWKVSPMATATGQVTASTLLMLPLVLLIEAPWRLAPPSTDTVLALLGLAGVSTALAYLLYFRLLSRAGAVNLLLVTFLIPVSAIWLGFMFLEERLAVWELAGMGVIGVGLAVLDGRPLAYLARRSKREAPHG